LSRPTTAAAGGEARGCRLTAARPPRSYRRASSTARRLLLESSAGEVLAAPSAVTEHFCREEKRVLFPFGSEAAAQPRASCPRAPLLPRGFGAQTATQRRVAAASAGGARCDRWALRRCPGVCARRAEPRCGVEADVRPGRTSVERARQNERGAGPAERAWSRLGRPRRAGNVCLGATGAEAHFCKCLTRI